MPIRVSSRRFENCSVALLRSLGRGADERADLLPRHTGRARVCDCVYKLMLGTRSCDDGALEDVFLDRDLDGLIGVEVLEAQGEFVGVVEDVLD
jgi:hypothetical protein